MITLEDIEKLNEIARLHDEAFWWLHQFDGHAKSSDGAVTIEMRFGNVWERNDAQKKQKTLGPQLGVSIYSYVVASETPLYPNFGSRHHYFETVDEALEVMKEWHAKAMSYQPTAEELAEADEFAAEMWGILKDKVTVIDISEEADNE